MSAYKCDHCRDTGESKQDGMLDCTKCDAASTRANLNDMVKALGPITREDLAWALYQAGVKAAEQRFAAERTELVAALYTMRGWAMSEVIADGDPDWALDMAKTNVLLKKNMGGKAWKS